MMRRHMMMGGMMPGNMGFDPWAESSEDCYCPRCGGPFHRGGGRRFLSKEERKERLKKYMEDLEAEAKAVKEELEEE